MKKLLYSIMSEDCNSKIILFIKITILTKWQVR